MEIICIDIGGSSVKSGRLTQERGKPLGISSVNTHELADRKFTTVKKNVLMAIKSQIPAKHLSNFGVGISTSGSVDKNEVVISAGHFSGYENIDWQKLLNEEFSGEITVAVANDGRAAALGEFTVVGATPNSSHVHLVVGTGVGGGIVHEGKLLVGESGQAGYIGHIKLTTEPTITCSCKKQGCLETLASAPAIVEHYIRGDGGSKNEVSFPNVVKLAKDGNEHAVAAFKKAGYFLGIGIGNTLNILNSSSVTVGGGVVVAAQEVEQILGSPFFFDAVDEGFIFASHRRVYASAQVSPATLGNNSGMIGAGVLVSKKL